MCTSQIAARRIDARHVRMVSTELLGLAANPRAAIREPQSASCGPVASRSSQIAARSIEARHVLRHDCSSQSTAASQLADRGAGSPVPPIAACTSQLARRRLLRRGSKADPILLSQNRRPHSRRSQHFGQEVKAEVELWFALSQFAGRKVQEFEQEGLSSRGQIACLQGAGCMKCPRSGVVSGGLHI